jgi:3-methyl-2-oxobutanoate hydroxymethyltransferase
MNVLDFRKMKLEERKISMLTCYDATSARILESSQVDTALVGDSVSMVVHGFPSTVHATIEMMEFHTAAVARGLKTKFLVADLPFLSFRKGIVPALEAVDRLVKAGAQAVKLEGVQGHEDVISRIVESGVPVMGHLGLTPQSVHQLGGFRVQGRDEEQAETLLKDALSLEKLGCFAVVLECVPARVARLITEKLKIPTIGIGAGVDVDGQVLVMQDMLSMNQGFKPKFLRAYFAGESSLKDAFDRFHKDVVAGAFPNESESYT